MKSLTIDPFEKHPRDKITIVLIVAELARGRRRSRNLNPNLCPGQDLNPIPLHREFSTLTTTPSEHLLNTVNAIK